MVGKLHKVEMSKTGEESLLMDTEFNIKLNSC
jgi:hypothetical protein